MIRLGMLEARGSSRFVLLPCFLDSREEILHSLSSHCADPDGLGDPIRSILVAGSLVRLTLRLL